ncbi:MAG: hypothetical protein ACK5LC_09485, partial [Coprobacillaceae bacterium]
SDSISRWTPLILASGWQLRHHPHSGLSPPRYMPCLAYIKRRRNLHKTDYISFFNYLLHFEIVFLL